MPHSIRDFDYTLPKDRIAQKPATPRELAKLMVVHKNSLDVSHATVGDLPNFFRPDDIVVLNNTKVFKARLHGQTSRGTRVELFLIRPVDDTLWSALAKPGRKINVGDTITVADDFSATVQNKQQNGILQVSFSLTPEQVIAKTETHGEVPIPPYISTIPTDGSYQTVYAKHVGSVAAPTAGFHITKHVLSRLKNNGVTVLEITLHVGLGTFLPIKTEHLESHEMHSEWVHISHDVATRIMQAKQEKRRIVAIGTTTVRTLEGVASLHDGKLIAYEGDVSLFISPGFRFHIVDAMLTNFHLPKSTLIVLVSAFAGTNTIRNAYNEAIIHDYRFYSFGDAMFIQ